MEVELASRCRELDAHGLLVHLVVLGHHGHVFVIAAEQVEIIVVERFVSLVCCNNLRNNNDHVETHIQGP